MLLNFGGKASQVDIDLRVCHYREICLSARIFVADSDFPHVVEDSTL